ncbi:MAG TPA: metallophosphoesterase [Sphingomonas sp.]|nr:metallophosphoesterase [Sphingomonas sp.]
MPAGQRVYAIGDVHGCAKLLDALIARIDADDAARGAAQTILIFLGDLIDRGPDSAQAVERVRTLTAARSDVRLIVGNHEEVFLDALKGDSKALRLFCRIGGRETAISYGMSADAYERADYDDLGRALDELVPDSHRQLLAGGSDMEIVGDYAFVHAGVRPDRPLEEQSVGDLRWIRGSFLDHDGELAKRIVHGHTISDTVEYRDHRIGVDTGAYVSGRLSAIGLEGVQAWTIEVS